ncbi:family 43 glycosylhydrolase [Parablautia intestinalis]|uniref:family 43 glycosylhydrolase n=1 Tax=Parablautia intestinalis TaxID=2320100 RepID=UPI00256F51D6|nr:family 43 glycosylhydrolase [Parablautia intestinalis]MCI8614607.1 family 43 glycosylhydrolase [Lachnospiraceae bacterium]
MNIKAREDMSSAERIAFYDCEENKKYYQYGTGGGWKKYENNPVFGGKYGTCFDVTLLAEEDKSGSKLSNSLSEAAAQAQPVACRGWKDGKLLLRMWFSWRPQKGIGYTQSHDGINWSAPQLVLPPLQGSGWEADEVNRPTVIFHKGQYMMWYSGQMKPYREDGRSVIGFAVSHDGIIWERKAQPVIEPDQSWEKQAVMCPHVLYDEDEKLYKMWYAAGCNHEPDAIGYAESHDGVRWEKYHQNPILARDPAHLWEQHKVVAPCVVKENGWFYMFYVGHLHEERAQVGLARSRDGITGWEKHPDNPLIAPTQGAWDSVAVYKPFVMKVNGQWLMWYNGAAYEEPVWVFEQIGLAYAKANHLFPDAL